MQEKYDEIKAEIYRNQEKLNKMRAERKSFMGRESHLARIVREEAERKERESSGKLIHPSQRSKPYESSGDAKFDAVAEVILAKLESHSQQISKQTEIIMKQSGQLDELKEAVALMMQTYFEQIQKFSASFASMFSDGKSISHEELQERTNLLADTIDSAEPAMFKMGSEETQAIYDRIMPSIREELAELRGFINVDNNSQLYELAEALGGEIGIAQRELRGNIHKAVENITYMSTNLAKSTQVEHKKNLRDADSYNSRSTYLQ